ncbi:MAG TPA: response regulator [Candidatus Thermoplasmatota archaeon]|nr:response regulator [Candidatus Thermoplasmatota archaeon]
MRVLLIEDDPTFAKLLQLQLRTLADPSCEVVLEASLSEARRRLARERFDVVFSDMGLPDSRGAKTIEAVAAAANGAPIIVLSGSDQAPPGRAFLRKGDVDPAQLAAAIRQAIGGRAP